jgi:uncharacterized protein
MPQTVCDNHARHRYELDVGEGVAFINYRRSGLVVTMTHAEVPRALAGRGLGTALLRGALELVREQGGKVVAQCPFVAAYIARHRESQDLLAGPDPGADVDVAKPG